MIKLSIERCLEWTRLALFLSSSLMHSMIYLFLSIILSHIGISLFFILALSLWTSWMPWPNRFSKSSCLMYPLSAKTFQNKTFANTVHTLLSLSSTFAPIRQNVITSPESLHSKCSLNPWGCVKIDTSSFFTLPLPCLPYNSLFTIAILLISYKMIYWALNNLYKLV